MKTPETLKIEAILHQQRDRIDVFCGAATHQTVTTRLLSHH